MIINGAILTVQGHPEFDTATGRLVLRAILDKKAIPIDFSLRTPHSEMVAREMVKHWWDNSTTTRRRREEGEPSLP